MKLVRKLGTGRGKPLSIFHTKENVYKKFKDAVRGGAVVRINDGNFFLAK